MIHPDRVQTLSDRPADPRGKYVLYWMQASVRTDTNHALEYAIHLANGMKLPLAVVFGLMDDYPEANLRHYGFLCQGLVDVARRLSDRRLTLSILRGHPAEVAIGAAAAAATVVVDRGYLRHQRQWREQLAERSPVRVVQVESEAVIPVESASQKDEYAARTLRPKIHRLLSRFLTPLAPVTPEHGGVRLDGAIEAHDAQSLLASLKVDRSIGQTTRFVGGETEAIRRLEAFVAGGLDRYEADRNEPSLAATSTMSPYLHFGHISPLKIALSVIAADAAVSTKAISPEAAARVATSATSGGKYLEELIVRRELAVNHAWYCPKYDQYDALPEWARKSLSESRMDPRPQVYTRQELLNADTHDPWWNASQTEMNRTGFMHNYMRMYWGKKILEWSPTPREGFETTLWLNNRLFLDGRDPASYANVGWIYGLHDRPWGPRRPIFGLIRYMNAAGLKRKFDMDAYVRWVAGL